MTKNEIWLMIISELEKEIKLAEQDVRITDGICSHLDTIHRRWRRQLLDDGVLQTGETYRNAIALYNEMKFELRAELCTIMDSNIDYNYAWPLSIEGNEDRIAFIRERFLKSWPTFPPEQPASIKQTIEPYKQHYNENN